MDRTQVIGALIAQGLYNGLWDLDDETYEPISPAFILQARRSWIDSLPAELVVVAPVGGGASRLTVRWVPEVFDCDNIARDFGVFLARCMAVESVKTNTSKGNTASGKINFYIDPTSAHAVNWFVDYQAQVHVFDAGSSQMDHLTRPQLQSIFYGETI